MFGENKNGKKKIKRLFFRIMLVFSSVAAWTICSFAAEGDQWKSFYIINADILETNSLLSSGLRSVGWAIVKWLVSVTDTVQTLYDKSFGFIDMTTNPVINDFVQRFKPAFVALTALALLYLGYILIMKHDKKPDIGVNICIAILCVSCSTFIFGTLNSLAYSFKTGVDSYSYKGADKAAMTIVDESATDVLKLYKKYGVNLKPADYKKNTAGITEKNFGYFRINSLINYSSDDFDTEENPFKYRITGSNPSGEPIIKENSNGWGINSGDDEDFGNDFYYRYKFDWLSAYIQLVAVIIVYVAMAYKCVRVAFELVVARLLAYLYSAELSGGEKIRKILCFIRDSYILLGVTAICIKLYAVFTGFIHSYVGSGLVSAVFSLFLAFTVIDGPNLVEKLLGMDAGLRSSTARMMAIGGMAIGAGRAAGRTGTGLYGTGRKLTEKLKEAKGKSQEAAELAVNAGEEKAKEAMDKGAGQTSKTSDLLNAAAPGAQDKEGKNNFDPAGAAGKENKDNSGSPDFMDRAGMDNRADRMDAADRMNRSMDDQMEKRMDKSLSGKSGTDKSGDTHTSMPKRTVRTKSRYISKNRKGEK